jgi:hypothetical protein
MATPQKLASATQRLAISRRVALEIRKSAGGQRPTLERFSFALGTRERSNASLIRRLA